MSWVTVASVAANVIQRNGKPQQKWMAFVELEVRDFLCVLCKIGALHSVKYDNAPHGSHGSQEPPKYGVIIKFKNAIY